MIQRRSVWKKPLAGSVAILILLVGGISGVRAQGESDSGDWVGGYRLDGETVLFSLGLEESGSGGRLVPLNGSPPALLTEVTFNRNEIRFTAPRLAGNLVFEGRLEGGEASGVVILGDRHGPFFMARRAAITPEDFDPLIGTYHLGPEEDLLLTRADGVGQLFYQQGDLQVRLYPLGERRFFSQRGERIGVLRSPQGDPAGLEVWDVLGSGETRTAPRVALYREQAVQFTSSGVRIAGSLLLPDTERPHPAVVLLHGAGAGERQLYRIYADAFVRRGIAVLIYDRRGSGASGGKPAPGTLSLLAADAAAALDSLVRQPEVRPDQTGLWGFSQGGRLAPMVAAAAPDQTAFVIVVSAPGMSQDDLALGTRAAQYRRAGYPAFLGEMGWKLARLRQDWRRLGAANQGEKAAVRAAGRSPADYWAQVGQPVLALYGERDKMIPAQESAALIWSVLEAAGNPDVAIRVFPEVGHDLAVTTSGGLFTWTPGFSRAAPQWVLERFPVDGTLEPEETNGAPGLAGEQIWEGFPAPGAYGPTGKYGRRPWYGGLSFQLAVFLFYGLGFLLAGIVWPWRGPKPLSKTARIGVLLSLWNLGLLAVYLGLVFLLLPGSAGEIQPNPLPGAAAGFPFLGLVSGVLLAWFGFGIWRGREDAGGQKSFGFWEGWLLAAGGVFLWFLGYWNSWL